VIGFNIGFKIMSWYKKAQKVKEKAEKKPYRVIKICFGQEEIVAEIDAYSAEQARMFALQDNIGDVKAYMEVGCDIVARLNKEEFERIQGIKEYEEKRKEEQIQNAWWQD